MAMFKLKIGTLYPFADRYRLGRPIDNYRAFCVRCQRITAHETLATETTDDRQAEVEACWECGLIEKGVPL